MCGLELLSALARRRLETLPSELCLALLLLCILISHAVAVRGLNCLASLRGADLCCRQNRRGISGGNAVEGDSLYEFE